MVPGRRYTPEAILRLAWRRRWLIVLPLVAFAAGTMLISQRMPNRYRSETLIMVIPQRIPESYVRATVTAPIEERLQSISQQILSRTKLEAIIQEFNLYTEARAKSTMEDVVERMRTADIKVDIMRQADSFRVSYKAADPVIAMKVTERLATLFIEENLQDRALLASSTSAFLESQMEDARRRLMEQEKKIEEYRRQYAGELPTQLQFNLQGMQSTQQQLQSLSDSINRDKDRRFMIERTVTELSTALALTQAPDRPEGTVSQDAPPAVQLEVARTALKNLETRYKPGHPDVVRMKRAVDELARRVATERESPSAPAGETPALSRSETAGRNRISELRAEMESLDRQIAYTNSEIERIRGTYQTYQARVEAVPARESDYAALARDYDTQLEMYKGLLKKREEAKLAENLERRQVGEQFRIIDPARRPERPFEPNRLRINLMGTGLGLVLGLALVILLEYSDNTLRGEAEAHAILALPILAQVPPILTKVERRRARLKGWAVSLAASAFTLLCLGVVLLGLHKQGIF
jgi:protein tyrosine kinase modulator